MSLDDYLRACSEQDARHREDPQFADYLDGRSARARRVLGLPVLFTPEDRAEQAWADEQAERCYEQPSMWGVMDG